MTVPLDTLARLRGKRHFAGVLPARDLLGEWRAEDAAGCQRQHHELTTTYFLNDGTDKIAEYDSTKTVTNRYIPGPAIDEPIAMENASTGAHEYFHTNRQGSVIAMSNASNGHLAEGPYVYDA